MGRAPCCDKANVKKGPWSPEEDAKLKEYIEKSGTGGNWIALPQKAGLRRCGKSCRLRWLNYLRPNIKHGEFSDEEDRVICTLYASIGSRWSIIAAQLPGRTDNDIKNYWNTKLKKKLMGLVSTSQKIRPLHNQHHIITNYNYYPQIPFNQTSSLVSSSPYSSTTTIPCYESTIPSLASSSFLNTASASCTSGISGSTSGTVLQVQESYVGGPTTSSDGSYTNQMSQGRDQLEYDYGVSNGGENLDFHNYLYNNGIIGLEDQSTSSKFLNIEAADEKPIINANSCYVQQEQNPLDYSLEEIKQLISTNNVTCNSNFFVDENKIEEKVMMYY